MGLKTAKRLHKWSKQSTRRNSKKEEWLKSSSFTKDTKHRKRIDRSLPPKHDRLSRKEKIRGTKEGEKVELDQKGAKTKVTLCDRLPLRKIWSFDFPGIRRRTVVGLVEIWKISGAFEVWLDWALRLGLNFEKNRYPTNLKKETKGLTAQREEESDDLKQMKKSSDFELEGLKGFC